MQQPAEPDPIATTIERNHDGTWKPGHAPLTRSGGRPPLPECFTSLEPLALAQLAAFATGVVLRELIPEHLDEEEHQAALAALQVSACASDKLRLDACERLSNRVRGMPKAQVDHSGGTENTVTEIRRVIVEVRQVETPTMKQIKDAE